MRLRLITVRNRLDVLLFVFVASYFLCCGDVELNPGPVDSDSPSQQQHDTEEHSVTPGRPTLQQAMKTARAHVTPLVTANFGVGIPLAA
ncbi:hypothetical protein ACOMHN_053684 [Nucella lapillus]